MRWLRAIQAAVPIRSLRGRGPGWRCLGVPLSDSGRRWPALLVDASRWGGRGHDSEAADVRGVQVDEYVYEEYLVVDLCRHRGRSRQDPAQRAPLVAHWRCRRRSRRGRQAGVRCRAVWSDELMNLGFGAGIVQPPRGEGRVQVFQVPRADRGRRCSRLRPACRGPAPEGGELAGWWHSSRPRSRGRRQSGAPVVLVMFDMHEA